MRINTDNKTVNHTALFHTVRAKGIFSQKYSEHLSDLKFSYLTFKTGTRNIHFFYLIQVLQSLHNDDTNYGTLT